MSVVGIDLGTTNSVLAVARNRGVDVVTNEVSNRATPSLVGFGPKCRYIGEAAKNQEVSNLKNTVSSLSRLAGRSMKDPDVLLEQDFVSAPLVEVDGQVGAEVTYLGKKDRFTATQLVAMLLTKLKQTTAAEIKSPVSDIVLSCPTWYTDAQRRALLDATDIAGLKCLRLINDTTASALGYGITKTDLPASDERPRRVCFIDIGHSNYTCSIVEFRKAELVVKATAWDRHFGGRYFDRAIVDHFAKEFKEKFKIDVNENPKARFRVAAAVEKLKKILSANTSAPLNIESVMNDIDVRGMLKRDELEDLVRPLLDRITVPIEQALADANLQIDDIDSVEMVGGCTRVPALKSAIQSFFNKPLSFTLNQDEAVARGCAFSCAILSPAFRVRDFAVHDLVAYPIDFSWEPSPDIPDEDMSLTVFTKGSLMPSTKILTFYRKHVFDLEAKYAMPELLPGKTAPWIGRFSVKGVKPDSKGDFMICKLKARLNLHGVLNVEAGYWVEDQEEEEPVSEAPKEEGNSDAMDVDKEAPSDKPKTRKKKLTRKGDLTLSAGTTSMDMATKEQALERENQMFMEDKLVADTENQKNELESFIYELKDKITSTYADFANDDEKAKLAAKLDTVENWLYDEGDDASKAQYVSKMDDIRAIAGPIMQRYNDKVEGERQAALKAHEEAVAAKRAEQERQKRAEESKKLAEAGEPKDEAMPDADAARPDEVDEA